MSRFRPSLVLVPLLLACGVASVGARTFVLTQTYRSPRTVADERFGAAVAAVGNDVLVGAPDDGTQGDRTGAAYLFDGDSGALLQSFFSPIPEDQDEFGSAVSGAGGKVVVGVPGDDSVGAIDAGAAYVYEAATGAFVRSLYDPNPTAGDAFGAVLADLGGNVAIAAPYADGKVHVFEPAGGALLKSMPAPSASTQFGAALANVGGNLLVGAPQDVTPAPAYGAAYLFDPMAGTVLGTFINPQPADPDPGFAGFGFAVGGAGDTIVIGAPLDATAGDTVGSAYVFDRATGTAQRRLTNPSGGGDSFALAVLGIDGAVVVGAPYTELSTLTAGTAVLFDSATGNVLATLADPDAFADGGFGSVMARVGNDFLIGAPGTSAVYRFSDRSCGDGVVDAVEGCDDGNTSAGDGCDSACRLEAPPALSCYRTKPTAGAGHDLKGTTLGGVASYCTVADVSGAGLPAVGASLACFSVAGGSSLGRDLTVDDAFGRVTVAVNAQQTLCLPTDGGQRLSRFACYAAKTKRRTPHFKPRRTMLADALAATRANVLKPVGVCTALDAAGQGFAPDASYLTCYKVRDRARPSVRELDVQTAAGSDHLALARPRVLCLPSVAE